MAGLTDIFRIAADKRSSLSEVTDACRLFNGVGDGIAGVTLDRFGDRYQLQFFSADAVKDYEQIKSSVLDLFQPEFLVAKFRTLAERGVENGLITPRQRRDALEAYRNGLSGYTYYEL